MSDGGSYVAAGTIFDYRRIDGTSKPKKTEHEGVTEWITATGPITEQVYLMVKLKSQIEISIPIEFYCKLNS